MDRRRQAHALPLVAPGGRTDPVEVAEAAVVEAPEVLGARAGRELPGLDAGGDDVQHLPEASPLGLPDRAAEAMGRVLQLDEPEVRRHLVATEGLPGGLAVDD